MARLGHTSRPGMALAANAGLEEIFRGGAGQQITVASRRCRAAFRLRLAKRVSGRTGPPQSHPVTAHAAMTGERPEESRNYQSSHVDAG